MKLGTLCLISAALFGVVGMLMGLAMGIGGNFRLAHAHSHINLAGWVTLALYGLYHQNYNRRRNTLPWLQAMLALTSTPVFTAGLTAYLLSGTRVKAFIIVAMLSGIVVALSMCLFLVVVVVDARAAARGSGPNSFRDRANGKRTPTTATQPTLSGRSTPVF